MIIVSGQIFVRPERRDAFLAASMEAVVQARQTADCLDFVVAADPLDPSRINIYERWASEAALSAFRGEGPNPGLMSEIVRADVQRHHIAFSGAP